MLAEVYDARCKSGPRARTQLIREPRATARVIYVNGPYSKRQSGTQSTIINGYAFRTNYQFLDTISTRRCVSSTAERAVRPSGRNISRRRPSETHALYIRAAAGDLNTAYTVWWGGGAVRVRSRSMINSGPGTNEGACPQAHKGVRNLLHRVHMRLKQQ